MRKELQAVELVSNLVHDLHLLEFAATANNWDLAWQLFIDSDSLFSELRDLIRDQVIKGDDDGK